MYLLVRIPKYSIQLVEKIHHVTLYYYDRAGRLVRTVSPKGVDGGSLSTQDPPHTFVSRFHTDSRGRLLTKTVPDGGTERYYYDKYGRLRFIIDAVQWADDPKSMTYLKYDNLDRVVETGEVRGVTDFTAAVNTNANDMTWPGTSTQRRDVARYHYDAKASISTESGWNAVTAEHPGFTQRSTRLRLSWTDAVADWPANVTDINDLENVVRTFYSYDPHGSATTVINDIPVTSDPETDRLITRTDYTYDLSTGNVTAVDFQKDKPSDRFQHRYTYDAGGRMKIVETSRNGVLWDRDVVYDYNLDGSLRRETIGEDSVQGRDYTYTLLGQLKGINHPTLDSDKDPGGDGAATGPHANVGKDAFGMSFHYHEDDFLRSHNTTASPFNDAEPSMLGVPQPNNAAPYNLYSGYIGGWAYRTQATNGESVLRDGMLLGERFRHDKIGRLRSDTTYTFDGTNWISDGNGGWGTRYVLDQNSNLVHIKRWAMTGTTTSVLYDDATLNLVSNQSNALATVSDAINDGVAGYNQELANAVQGDVVVDQKGRVIQSELGGLENTTDYTSFDVPKLIARGSNDVSYTRDAFGEIVRVDIATNNTWAQSISIIPGSVVADQAVYLQDEAEASPTIAEWSVVGLTRIGANRGTGAAANGNIYHRNVGHIRYELTDHLGSIRAIVSDVKLIVSGEGVADVLSIADYEPYGATRSRRSTDLANEASYRHAFQGMRLLEGSIALSEYRTPFRLYDGRTGRWAGLDPIQQPWTSPYEGLGSLPTSWTDLWGLEITNQDLPASAKQLPTIPVEAKAPTRIDIPDDMQGRQWREGDFYHDLLLGDFNYHKGQLWAHDDYKSAVQTLFTRLNVGIPEYGPPPDKLSDWNFDVGSLGFDLESAQYSDGFIATIAEISPLGLQPADDIWYIGGPLLSVSKTLARRGATRLLQRMINLTQSGDDIVANAFENDLTAKGIGILRDAARGKGNFGLGQASRIEADQLGKAWVGDGYEVASDGVTLISKDKLRQYRPPSFKPKLGRTQANFERKFTDQKSKQWQSNGHLDITD